MSTLSQTRYFEPIPFPLFARDPVAFAKALGTSFRETGFAVISEHSVDQAVIDRATAAAKAFFALPEETKRSYYSDALAGQRGYTPFGTENAKGKAEADLKEFWHTGRALSADMPAAEGMLPTPKVADVADFDAATRALYDALDTMGQDLLRAIAIDLGLEREWFTPRVETGNSVLRLLHYPPQLTPPPAGSVRAGAHEDINTITLLLGAEEAGLQVKHRSGEWLSVNPPAGSLVVNVGDMLQRLTNHVLPSTTHRVVNPDPERARFGRYSMPFFLHFASDVLIKTLPQCISADRPDAYPQPITAHEYLVERLIEIGLLKPKA